MYTREQVLGMVAGRNLDALVAEHVMGFIKTYQDCGLWGTKEFVRESDGKVFHPNSPVPEYSTDIAAVWEVVEKFNEITVKRFETMKGHRYVCRIELTYDGEPIIAQGETASEAICKAALLSLLKED